jgi:hypothetical protein
MHRDLHVVELICYSGEQELGKAQAPQLEAVRHTKEHLIDRIGIYGRSDSG